MAVLLLMAHPRPDSLTRALASACAAGITAEGIEVDTLDLYESAFSPVLSRQDLAGVADPAVLAHQARVRAAEALVLAYPVWWATPPALLQGWLQRVLSENFAYRYTDHAEGLLQIPVTLLVTVGSEDTRLASLYRDPIESVFRYCGCHPVVSELFWGIHPGAPQDRYREAEARARAAGLRLAGALPKRAKF